uniref:U6 snRNA phosphodiesterase 1 n=1 Tax=Babesia bovis TaxID=5865 RepID=A7AWM2_BABBO|eukprot:XP_001609018.1 hypothetical protein [Babesia bovis T2Bo]
MKRTVPHVAGNFHTLVYIREIALCAKKAFELLRRLHRRNQQNEETEKHESDSDGRRKRDFLHLSLCKPIYLKRQFIRPFKDRLEETLKRIKPFYLILDKNIAICANEERNNFFAVLPVETQCNARSISPLIDLVDDIAQIFGYQKYYEQRKPHVSLAVTGNLTSVMTELYKNEPLDGQLYSSHHWMQVERYLGKEEELECDTSDIAQETLKQNGNVEFIINEDMIMPYLNEGSSQDAEPICIYVKEIYILVGSQETAIELGST